MGSNPIGKAGQVTCVARGRLRHQDASVENGVTPYEVNDPRLPVAQRKSTVLRRRVSQVRSLPGRPSQ